MKSGRSSKRKGYGAERELAKILVAQGITEAGRTPLSGSLPDFPGDLFIHGYCPEVKRQETTSIWQWWAQTCAAARGDREPILFFRRNNSHWLALLHEAAWAGMEVELRKLRKVEVALRAWLDTNPESLQFPGPADEEPLWALLIAVGYEREAA